MQICMYACLHMCTYPFICVSIVSFSHASDISDICTCDTTHSLRMTWLRHAREAFMKYPDSFYTGAIPHEYIRDSCICLDFFISREYI